MIKNYFKIAWRSLLNHKVYTTLNIVGLAIGLTVFIITLLYINYERSYDNWDARLHQVYRVGVSEQNEEGTEKSASVQYPLGSFLQQDCPEVEVLTRTRIMRGETLIATEMHQFYENKVISADSNFFKIFPYKFIQGNPEIALRTPNTAVLTKAVCEKMFGTTDVIGKTFTTNQRITYTITGVMVKQGPSHLDFDICLAYHNTSFATNWFMRNHDTYVLLHKNARTDKLAQKATAVYAKNYALSQTDGTGGTVTETTDPVKWLAEQKGIKEPAVFFEQVKNIHTSPEAFDARYAGVAQYDFSHANRLPLIIFSIVGTLVLLLACINYTNMAIAQGAGRSKESGVRKVMGASRQQLMVQFLTESFLLCVLAMGLALILVNVSLSVLNKQFELHLSLWSSTTPSQNIKLLLQTGIVIVITATLSGVYPAFILSAYQPAKVLKGDSGKTIGSRWLRNSLVVVQYGIATCFIICIMIMSFQMRYMRNNDPGFNVDQVMRIETRSTLLFPGQPEDKSVYIKKKLLDIPGVTSVTTGESYPGMSLRSTQMAEYDGGKKLPMNFSLVNYDYFNTLGMQLVQGRAFAEEFGLDSVNAAVINETAAAKMGWRNPIGKSLDFIGHTYQVIGVVKDAHLAGYETAITPQIYMIGVDEPRNFSGHSQVFVKVNGSQSAAAMQHIIGFWKGVEPGVPVKYSWLDNDFGKLFQKYERLNTLIRLITLVALIIAIIGIFALSVYAAKQRTKEIGIRKVLGASVYSITKLLSASFIRLVIIAIIIAVPVAWVAMSRWLDNFAYRIDIAWWMIGLAGLMAVSVAVITISFHTIRSAITNPVKSLRNE